MYMCDYCDAQHPFILLPVHYSLLHGRSLDQNASEGHTIHFINVFLLMWGGAAVVTVNAQLLKGKVYVERSFKKLMIADRPNIII